MDKGEKCQNPLDHMRDYKYTRRPTGAMYKNKDGYSLRAKWIQQL